MTRRNRSLTVVRGVGAGTRVGFGSLLALVAGLSCSSKPSTSLLEGERGPDGALILPPTGAPMEMMTNGAGGPNPGTVMPNLGEGGSPSFDPTMMIPEPSAEDLTPEDSCGAVTAETTPLTVETEVVTTVPAPVAIYFVLDNSASMNELGNDETSRWTEAVDAVTAFVNDPGSAGLSAAIQYFFPEEANDNDVCDGTHQATAATPMGLLPENAMPIIASLAATSPDNVFATPTPGALTGGIDYCIQYEIDNPDTQCIVLLITDGVPTACGLSGTCDNPPPGGGAGGAGAGGAGAGGGPIVGGGMNCVDPNAISVLVPIAEEGAAAGVSTFAVGMEGVPVAGFAMLDAIAIAGGTDCTPGAAGGEACNVTTTGPAGFLEAFDVIRETIATTEIVTETVTQALECEWEIPPAADPDEPLELDRVNLRLTIPGTDPTNIRNVATLADCASAVDGVGWHYNEDSVPPTSIVACPNTCATIQAAEKPVVNILLGCRTNEPVVE